MDGDSMTLITEFFDNLFTILAIAWMVLGVLTKVIMLRAFMYVFVDIVSLNLEYHTISVSIQQLCFQTIITLYLVIPEFIH